MVVDLRRVLARRGDGLDHRGQNFEVDVDGSAPFFAALTVSATTIATASPTKRALSAGKAKCGASKGGTSPLLRNWVSAGCGDHGLCGTGFRPSARQSAPVKTASTPGLAPALSVAMARMRAWACGERTITA